MYVSPVSPLRSFRAVRSLAAGVLMLATLAGCAVAPYGEYEPDPAEPVNLAAAKEGGARKLHATLEEHLRAVGARVPRKNPDYEPR